jgi:hypothetical protein
LIKKLGVKNIGGISDELLPTISKVENMVIQSDYLRRLAERLEIHEASLRYEIGKVKPDYSYHYDSEAKVDTTSNNYRKSEIHLLGLAIVNKDVFSTIQNTLGLEKFRDKSVKQILEVVEGFFQKNEKIDLAKLLSRFEKNNNLKTAVMQAVAKADITKDVEKAVNECMQCVRKENREEELKTLTAKLKKAQESKNDSEMKILLERINKIHKEKVV